MTDTTTPSPPVVDRDTWTAPVNELRVAAGPIVEPGAGYGRTDAFRVRPASTKT
jgi:hypothetical protein